MTVVDTSAPRRRLILPGVVELPASAQPLELPADFSTDFEAGVEPPADRDDAVTDDEQQDAATSVAAPAATKSRARRPFELIDPNQAWVMWVGAVLNASVLTASLVLSFSAVYYAATWIGIPPGLQWLAVIMLDVAIVGFSWGLMVFSSRAADHKYNPDADPADAQLVRERTGRTRFFLIAVTMMSVVANVMKTWDYWEGDLSTAQAIFGVIYSASIPLWALAATEEVIRMIFARRRRIYQEVAA